MDKERLPRLRQPRLNPRCHLPTDLMELLLFRFVQITGLEPSSAFLFKSALYPCVIEFTVKRDGAHTRPASGSGTSAVARGAAALPSPAGGGEDGGLGGHKDDNPTAAGAAAAGVGGVSGGKGEGSSWLGQVKAKESSYKVRVTERVGGRKRRERFGATCGTGRVWALVHYNM